MNEHYERIRTEHYQLQQTEPQPEQPQETPTNKVILTDYE